MFDYLLRRYGSAVDCRRGRGSGGSRLGYGISPLGGVTINHTRTYTGLGNRLLEGKQNLVHRDPGESSDPTGDCLGLACGCPGVSGRGLVGGGLLPGWGH